VVATPSISGPTATAIAAAAITRPYAGGRPWGAKFPATSETIAGPIPSRIDRPMMRTARFYRHRGVVSEPAA
jgi:hypothetical protein